jgi:hypothetical protein
MGVRGRNKPDVIDDVSVSSPADPFDSGGLFGAVPLGFDPFFDPLPGPAELLADYDMRRSLPFGDKAHEASNADTQQGGNFKFVEQ